MKAGPGANPVYCMSSNNASSANVHSPHNSSTECHCCCKFGHIGTDIKCPAKRGQYRGREEIIVLSSWVNSPSQAVGSVTAIWIAIATDMVLMST